MANVVEKTIQQTILKHNLINKEEHIVMGLSGGPDSVCLFYVLKDLQKQLKFSLYAVHVNHKFRPGAAERDQDYVEELCCRNHIPCETFVYDCSAIAKEQGMSSEEAGRKVRYEAFGIQAERLIQAGIPREKVKVAVAQNADDQAETILMRLLRGTGPDGLAGMSYSRMEGSLNIIRPMLDTWRCDIEAYCCSRKLEPCIDYTNSQPIYTRNKVRLELIPYLQKQFNPNISESLVRLGNIARNDKTYLHECAEREYRKLVQSSGALTRQGLCSLKIPIRHRVIMKAFRKVGLTQDIAAIHLENADKLLQGSQEPASLDFPGGYRMELRYGDVFFCHRDQLQNKCLFSEYKVKLKVLLQEKKEFEESCVLQMESECRRDLKIKNYPGDTAIFDWDKLCATYGKQPEILLRTRQPGDFIRLKQGRKKIQDFFVDQKIPREQRDCIPMAAVGSEILWITAQKDNFLKRHKYSEQYLLDQTTKKVLVLELICEM